MGKLYRRWYLSCVTVISVLYAAAALAPLAQRVAALVVPTAVYPVLSPAATGSRLLLAVFGFFLVAFLSSHLAESLRRVGEELSAASASLAELERRREHILQNIASGLVRTDLAGRITYCNRAAERIAQITAEEVAGRHFSEIYRVGGGPELWASAGLLDGPPLRAEGGIAGREDEVLLGRAFSPLRDEGERGAGPH